jgi:ZIP family zinc transporter
MDGNLIFAFGLTLFAGLATGLGSLVVFLVRRPNLSLLSFGLGFSSGVMVYISLVELLPEASVLVGGSLGEKTGGWVATGCFFGGILVSAFIDYLVPDPENPHEAVSLEQIRQTRRDYDSAEISTPKAAKEISLARIGPLTALVIGIHNFPEGIATFASALSDTTLGVSIAIAVAIHNIPEGVSVAVPTYHATGSRARAFVYSFASGLAEPVGALLAYLVLMSFLTEAVVAGMLAAVAGIMVFISFDELLPAAREYGRGHTAIAGVVLGMAVMAVSLLLVH